MKESNSYSTSWQSEPPVFKSKVWSLSSSCPGLIRNNPSSLQFQSTQIKWPWVIAVMPGSKENKRQASYKFQRWGNSVNCCPTLIIVIPLSSFCGRFYELTATNRFRPKQTTRYNSFNYRNTRKPYIGPTRVYDIAQRISESVGGKIIEPVITLST